MSSFGTSEISRLARTFSTVSWMWRRIWVTLTTMLWLMSGTRHNSLRILCGIPPRARRATAIGSALVFKADFSRRPLFLERHLNAPFQGLYGIGPNGGFNVDLHPTYPYITSTNFLLDARPLNGQSNSPANSSTGCSLVGGSGTLYKCTAAQRGYTGTPAAVTGDMIIPRYPYCGRKPLIDVSGTSPVIDGTPATNYRYAVIVNASEISGATAGDLYANCPFGTLHYSNSDSYEPAGAFPNGGDLVDISVYPVTHPAMALMQVDMTAQRVDGSHSLFLTHGNRHPHWKSPFDQNRATPDARGGIFQSIGVDGYKDQMMMIQLPHAVFDTVNRTGFVPITIPINTGGPGGYAMIEWGYAENGNPEAGQFYCTSRTENCRSNSSYPTSGNPFLYKSMTQVPTVCASNCTITIQAISQRQVAYRLLRCDSSGVVTATGNLIWTGVP